MCAVALRFFYVDFYMKQILFLFLSFLEMLFLHHLLLSPSAADLPGFHSHKAADWSASVDSKVVPYTTQSHAEFRELKSTAKWESFSAEVFVWPCLPWWEVLSLFSRPRIDGVAVWHVRECCDVLRSPPGQQGDRRPFSTTVSAVTLMKDRLALVWSECSIIVMYGAAGPNSRAGTDVYTPLLAKCFPFIQSFASVSFSVQIYGAVQVVCIIPQIPFMTSWRIVCQGGAVYSHSLTFEYKRQRTKEAAEFTIHGKIVSDFFLLV